MTAHLRLPGQLDRILCGLIIFGSPPYFKELCESLDFTRTSNGLITVESPISPSAFTETERILDEGSFNRSIKTGIAMGSPIFF